MGFFFFAFTHSVDLQVDENDESKALPPLDPPPTRSPNRSPRMGRSVKARSMVIGKQINFQSYMPTIPSQIPKSQTLPANMSTPIITVRCHGNHDLPKKKNPQCFILLFPIYSGCIYILFITSLLYWIWFIKWDLFTFIFPPYIYWCYVSLLSFFSFKYYRYVYACKFPHATKWSWLKWFWIHMQVPQYLNYN